LNAATGEEVWKFVPSKYINSERVFHGRNRGLVYWEDANGGKKRIFNFVKDRVYAVDAKTGAIIESFGEGGFIDLRKNLPIAPELAAIEVTTPGIAYRNFLIVGSRVPEEHDSTPGDVRAYDTETGEFKWIFHTVPVKGEFGYDTWEWEEGEMYGGANPWGGLTVDEKRGWVFFATGSAAGDFIYGGTRKGANLFANSVVALDATTGERKWHYQTIHHDIFDYDSPPAPILATVNTGDGSRDIVVQLTKQGLTFVLDRDTGEPVFPVVELPVPASTVAGEEAWPTQPFPLRPPPLVRTHLTESDLSNIDPETHAYVLNSFRTYETGGLYTPASMKGVITLPGHQGGVEWGGAAFDPRTNVMFVNANEAPTIHTLKPLTDGDVASSTPVGRGRALYNQNCTACHGLNREGNPPAFPPLTNLALSNDSIETVIRHGRNMMPPFPQLADGQLSDLAAFLKSAVQETEQAEVVQAPEQTVAVTTSDGGEGKSPRYANIAPFFVDQNGYPAIAPPWGTLSAVDMARGAILWKVPLGEYPELVAKGIRNTGSKNFGGPVLTAGDVIFIAATADEKIRAFDKHTGRIVWEYQLPAGGYATPSVYMIDGKQFVVIAAGGGGKLGTKHGDSIIAFALPEAARSTR
jgi:quinoprotein glucose dehydrogenase